MPRVAVICPLLPSPHSTSNPRSPPAPRRECQKLAAEVEGANIWDKAVKLIEVDATKAGPEAKKTAGLDLGKYKSLLVKLKHKPMACA